MKCKHHFCRDEASENVISELCDYCLIFSLAHDRLTRREHIHCRQMKYGCECRCRTNIKRADNTNFKMASPKLKHS